MSNKDLRNPSFKDSAKGVLNILKYKQHSWHSEYYFTVKFEASQQLR